MVTVGMAPQLWFNQPNGGKLIVKGAIDVVYIVDTWCQFDTPSPVVASVHNSQMPLVITTEETRSFSRTDRTADKSATLTVKVASAPFWSACSNTVMLLEVGAGLGVGDGLGEGDGLGVGVGDGTGVGDGEAVGDGRGVG